MSPYTGRERIAAAMKRQFADRVPVSLPVAPYSANLIGCTAREFYEDPDKRVEALKKACNTFQPDTIAMGSDSFAVADALGGELADPIKTTIVQDQRCMTTWVVRKVS